MRGHLGSGIERKAESVLRLTKTDEVITVTADPTRKASITGDRCPRFEWSYDAGMHVSCGPKESKLNQELQDLCDKVFQDWQGGQMPYTLIIDRIMNVTGKTVGTAKTRLNHLLRGSLITKTASGLYLRK